MLLAWLIKRLTLLFEIRYHIFLLQGNKKMLIRAYTWSFRERKKV